MKKAILILIFILLVGVLLNGCKKTGQAYMTESPHQKCMYDAARSWSRTMEKNKAKAIDKMNYALSTGEGPTTQELQINRSKAEFDQAQLAAKRQLEQDIEECGILYK